MEMVRCFFLERKILNQSGEEVVNTSVYFLNRLPTKVLQDMTPYKAWFGINHQYNISEFCGCICYYRVLEIKRNKLDNKAYKRHIYGLQFIQRLQGFLFKIRKIILNREVMFDEENGWFWKIRIPIILICFQISTSTCRRWTSG